MPSGQLEEIYRLIEQAGVYKNLFDLVRLVDAQQGKVIEIGNGRVVETQVNCVDVFGAQERCKNCTSVRALYSNQQVVKLEYLNGEALLIISAPIQIEGRHLVAELVKNITSSMAVDNRDQSRQDDVYGIIENLNLLAVTDPLTNLMNRRFINERLPNILLGSQLIGQPASVAMIDIDYFKRVNDQYGHPAGDCVLSSLAQILSSFIRRESDFAARYGGEEFLLCYPGIPLATCHELCEQIRERVEQQPFVINGETIQVTVSIGVAESGETETPDQDALISLADKRMYQAKAAGRNRVV